MKKLSLVKLVALISALLLLLALPAFAEEGDEPAFTVSDDGNTLIYNQVTYTRYDYYDTLTYRPWSLYLHNDEIDTALADDFFLPDSYYSYATVPEQDGIVLVVTTHYPDQEIVAAFVTEEVRASLALLAEQGYDNAVLQDGYVFYRLDEALIQSWDRQTATHTVQVTELKRSYQCLPVHGYDQGLVFSHVHGALYENEYGAYFYLNYDALDNTHFDSSGNFSYRQGTVSLLPLTEQDAKAMDTLRSKEDGLEFNVESEHDENKKNDVPVFVSRLSFAFFWCLLFALPAVIIGSINLKRALTVNRADPKRNTVIAALAAGWLLVAILILLYLFLTV